MRTFFAICFVLLLFRTFVQSQSNNNSSNDVPDTGNPYGSSIQLGGGGGGIPTSSASMSIIHTKIWLATLGLATITLLLIM